MRRTILLWLFAFGCGWTSFNSAQAQVPDHLLAQMGMADMQLLADDQVPGYRPVPYGLCEGCYGDVHAYVRPAPRYTRPQIQHVRRAISRWRP
jgi:hypothetical protein